MKRSAPSKRRILVLVAHYLPGYRGGGPARSVENLVTALGQEFSFFVVALAWDLGARDGYKFKPGLRWTRVGFARVRYLSRSPRDWWLYLRVLRSSKWDVVYLNSFFERQFSMLPVLMRWLGLLRCSELLLAPRGEFSPGALRFKRGRKMLYCVVAKALNLYRGVTWQASTEQESAEIARSGFGRASSQATVSNSGEENVLVAGNIVVASDLPDLMIRTGSNRAEKRAGCLECVFISRIVRKKNLAQCAAILGSVAGRVRFRIVGPIEDRSYWGECAEKLSGLPENVTWEYLGEAAPNKVRRFFEESHLFLFPTFGENFGHVIVEALASGCPVLTTDQTPWLGLEDAGGGWVLPIDDLNGFKKAVEAMINLDDASFQRMSLAARSFVINHPGIAKGIEANRQLFSRCTGGSALKE